MRINLWSVLDVVTWDKLGTETDDCADGTALAVLALARNYEEFLVCETWQDVKEKLDAVWMRRTILTAIQRGISQSE